MPTPPPITPLADAEIDAVIDLWSRCGLTRPWNDPVADVRLARTSGHGEVLAARDEGRIVAAAMVGHDGHRGAIYYLAVDPAHRRGGLGRRLVAAAEAWCRARGVPKINLLVRRENAGVLAFYAAIGFADTDCVSLWKAVDPDRAAHETALKAEWAARLAEAAAATPEAAEEA